MDLLELAQEVREVSQLGFHNHRRCFCNLGLVDYGWKVRPKNHLLVDRDFKISIIVIL